MTNKKSTKRALLMSVLAMLLCVTMLVGTTFAWFTDSVTSSGNIIKSGTLKIGMYWADGQTEVPTDKWPNDAADGAIFKNDNWEPGFVMARHIKIANEGSLALKYQVKIAADGEVSDITDVIDVYYADPAVTADRTLAGLTRLGTLTEVLAGMDESANGVLLADTADTITIALKMQENAGNEYQDKSIGAEFAIQLIATQYTYEDDSFGPDYDEGALYPVTNQAELSEALANAESGDTIILTDGDYTISGTNDVVIVGTGADTVIDINGNIQNVNISNATVTGNNSLNVKADNTAVFTNVIFDGKVGYVQQGVVNGDTTFVGCTFNGGIHIDSSASDANVKFEDCTFDELGIMKLGGSASYSFEGCTIETIDMANTTGWGRQWVIVYSDVTFTDCQLGRVIRAGAAIEIVLDGCVDAEGNAVTTDIVHTYNSPSVIIR